MIALNDFYGFDQTPFTKSIATENLYPSRGHQEVQGRLTFALSERLPALITGEVGTGKSTALRAFAHSRDRNVYRVVYLSSRVESWRAHLRVRWLLHTFRVVLSPAPIVTFPAPASSNPTYGFPVLGCPVSFFAKGYATYLAGSAFGA